MYAVASLRCPLVSASFAWQAWDNVHCQGVGCTSWRPSGVPWSPPRGTMCTAKGSDVHPGVPPVSLGLRRFCVAGVGQCALPRGRMYALASLRCPLVSAAFAWQAWDNVHCQGVGCTPWRPSGVAWFPPLLRDRRGTMCTAKGSDVRPGVPPVSLGLSRFGVAGVGQRALPRGRIYALASLRCPLVSAAFAWQAWDNVHCQGVGCTPWCPSGVPPVSVSLRCPSGVPWSPPLLRGRHGTMCTAKGSDARPGVLPVSLGLRRFCVAGVGQRALPRGRMYALASLRCPLVSAAFAWQAWDNVHCQGVGCTPWRPSGGPWSQPLLRGRRGTMCTAKGSDVRPGVPPMSLGFRRFCVAGVGQRALPRGRMYALASLRCPLVSAAFAWQAWDNVHCQGVGCTPWCPSGVPPVSLGLRRFCVAGGVGQCALPRGRMHALASLRCPLVSAAFAWQAWNNVHCQGVGCTPWRPSGVPWSPPLLRGRRGTTCTAKGSDVRPGVPPVSLGLRRFCVTGVGQCALPRGRMYALASLRCPLVSAAFAWQAWDNVHCQGVGCTPCRPSGVPWSPPLLRGRRGTLCTAKGSDVRPGVPPVSVGLRRFCVAGVGQCALPRGRMYALASLRCPSGVPWSPPLLRGRRGTMCTAKGSDVRPGVPPVSLGRRASAWQAWDNVHCQGVGCTPWRPSGVPPVSLGLRRFCVAGVGQCALPRGRMYALASLRWPLVSAAFAWQAWDNVHCQGVGCTPWRPSGVPWSPPLLRGRRGTMCTAKGSDVRPGVPPVSLGLRRFCVTGVGQCALPRGRMYALASLRCPLVSAAFAWQAWDNVHCQGVGCTPWRPSGVPWSPPLLRGRRGTMCTAKGSDVRPGVPPVSLRCRCPSGVPPVSLGLRRFCVAGVGQCALPRGRMYALASLRWPLVSAAFAWQAWDNVHCQGVGCTPWRPSGVPWSPPLLRGRRGTMCTAKGSDVRPGVPPVSLRCPSGVPPVSLGLRRFCVAGVGQRALPRGRMYALSAAFAWQAWDNMHCQGVGCTPWRPSGVPWSPPLLRGRRGTMCTAKGSDVRPGVPPVFLGLRRFCVAGVGQCALPRGSDVRPGVPPVSLRCPLVSAAFAWQAWDNEMCTAKGVGCTPWRPSGVPPVSLGLRRFCVAGVGQCALPRGRMYALVSLRCPLVSAAFAWQAWDNVHCQGGRMYALASLRCPSGVPWSPPLLRGRRGTMKCALPRGSDVRPGVPPVSLRCPLVSAAFAWQAWDNVHCQGVGCTPWRPSGVPPVVSLRCPLVSAAFAWQAWDNVHCQGVGCTPWRPSGVPWSPPLLRGRRGTMCAAKGGQMYALASLRCPLVSAAFAWQAWDNVHCQGVGCTPWRPSGVPWSPPLLRGRRGTMSTAKGSEPLRCPLVSAAFAWQAWDNVHCQGVGCTPWRPSGVPPVSLGLRRFCVAGVGQCALPRGRMYALAWGRMYALASLRCSLVSAAFAWQAWDNVHCQGVGCTPWRPSGVPWSQPLLRGRRGTTCTAKGSDVRPGVPPVSLGLRRFCVAGVGQCALPRGRMYALVSLRCPLVSALLRGRRGTMCTAKGSDVRPGVPPVSLRCPLVSAAFAWQAWDNVHCQGVGCTAWRPSGVPPVSLGLRRFCVPGVGQCALPRGRMYALASLRWPLISAAFAWQAWDNVHCQGVGGRMYALASLRCPLVSAAFAWHAWDNVHCQGVGCTPWRPSGVGVPPVSLGLRAFARQAWDNLHCQGVGCTPWRPSGVPPVSLRCPLVSAAFAWQAWDNVHCQGVGCTPWRPSGVPWSPPLLRGKAWDNVHCQGVGCMPWRGVGCTPWRPSGVPWSPRFCVAGVGQRALPRGRMYGLASLRCPLVSAAFAWQAWDNVHCQGVGCTPWRPLRCPSGVPWSPPLLRGRRGTTCTAKGSDVRPGVPPVSLGLRRFCVAGVGQ